MWSILARPPMWNRYVEQAEIKKIDIGTFFQRKNIRLLVEPVARRGSLYKYYVSEWGENIFPTQEEAEKSIGKPKGEQNENLHQRSNNRNK